VVFIAELYCTHVLQTKHRLLTEFPEELLCLSFPMGSGIFDQELFNIPLVD